ncbi:hypothetical protein ACFQ10_28455 [Streptomyces indonesiensis]
MVSSVVSSAACPGASSSVGALIGDVSSPAVSAAANRSSMRRATVRDASSSNSASRPSLWTVPEQFSTVPPSTGFGVMVSASFTEPLPRASPPSPSTSKASARLTTRSAPR